MKHSCIFILIVMLLCVGCQPTPEVGFVVNKGNDVVAEKLIAAPEGPKYGY